MNSLVNMASTMEIQNPSPTPRPNGSSPSDRLTESELASLRDDLNQSYNATLARRERWLKTQGIEEAERDAQEKSRS